MYERFLRLVENLQALSKEVEAADPGRCVDAFDPFLPETERELALRTAIEEELQRWPIRYRVRFDPTKQSGLSVETFLNSDVYQAVPFEFYRAFSALFFLARDGSLEALRQCEMCGKWLFAKNSSGDRRQRFCYGGICAKRWRETNPEYKQQQKQRAMAYRSHEKWLAGLHRPVAAKSKVKNSPKRKSRRSERRGSQHGK